MQLRDYQQEAVNKIINSNQNLIRQNFTGTGKSVEIYAIAQYYLDQGKTVYIVAPKDYLISAFARYFTEKTPYMVAQIKSGVKTIWKYSLFVCSIQTLYQRLEKLEKLPDVVLFDECHCLKAKTYETVVKFFQDNKARTIGWSATPTRLDGKGFDDLFDDLVVGRSYRWYIENGYLSDYEIPKISQYTKNFKLTRGEYDLKEQSEYYDNPTIICDAVTAWKKYCLGLKTVVFCTSIEHSKHVTDEYNKLGQEIYGRTIAAHIDAKTPQQSRHEIFKSLESNNGLLILCNFNLVTEGLDIPDVSVTQWLRLTQSEVIFDQGNGRSNRRKEGKTQYILDHVNNLAIHGLPCRFRAYDLRGAKRLSNQLRCSLCNTVILENKLEHKSELDQVFACPNCLHDEYVFAPRKADPGIERKRKQYASQLEEVEGFLDLSEARKINIIALCNKNKNRTKRGFWQHIAKIPDLTLTDYELITKIMQWESLEAYSGFSFRKRTK